MTGMRVLLFVCYVRLLRECYGARLTVMIGVMDRSGVVSAGHVGGTRGQELCLAQLTCCGMSVVRGM